MKLKKRFALSLRNNLRFIPDEVFIRMCFKAKLHYKLDLDHPKTFNEKLQWCKLHYHNPVLTTLVDKYDVRSFVSVSAMNTLCRFMASTIRWKISTLMSCRKSSC